MIQPKPLNCYYSSSGMSLGGVRNLKLSVFLKDLSMWAAGERVYRMHSLLLKLPPSLLWP